MFLAPINKSRNPLPLRFAGRVAGADLQHSQIEIQALLSELCRGFHLLTDLSQLEVMEVACDRPLGTL
jgi:hypothetical protein